MKPYQMNRDQLVDVAESAEELIQRLEAIHKDPRYQDVWFCYANHGGDYSNGPKYDKELAALKNALAGKQP